MEPKVPEVNYAELDEEMPVYKKANGCWSGTSSKCEWKDFEVIKTPPSGYIVDRRVGKGSSDHWGLTLKSDDSNEQAKKGGFREINYEIADDHVRVFGRVRGKGGISIPYVGSSIVDTVLDMKFVVHYRLDKPIPSDAQPQVPSEKLLITSRGLAVCFRSGEACLEVVPIVEAHDPQVIYKESIVDERPIRLNPALLTRESRLPAMKELLRKVQSAMTTSWRLPSRYPAGEVGFLESDYFKDRIKQALPKNQLDRPLSNITGLPEEVVKAFSDKMTVAQALEMDLSSFASKTGLSIAEASKARHVLLGLETGSAQKRDTEAK
jgi:hypothetical protein